MEERGFAVMGPQFRTSKCLLLCSRTRTWSDAAGTSQTCQQPTLAMFRALPKLWSGITERLCMTTKQAMIFSARARIQCMPPQMTPSQPSMASVSA